MYFSTPDPDGGPITLHHGILYFSFRMLIPAVTTAECGFRTFSPQDASSLRAHLHHALDGDLPLQVNYIGPMPSLALHSWVWSLTKKGRWAKAAHRSQRWACHLFKPHPDTTVKGLVLEHGNVIPTVSSLSHIIPSASPLC